MFTLLNLLFKNKILYPSSYLLPFIFFSVYHNAVYTQTPEEMILKLGIELTAPAAPLANYVPAVRVGNLLFLSGAGPLDSEGKLVTGRVGDDLSLEDGREAARLVAIRQLGVLKHELGDLGKVKRIVKVLGMVNCTDDFINHPAVINGFSDLMVEVFGEKGRHARSAVGMNSLPFNMAVEIEMIVEIED